MYSDTASLCFYSRFREQVRKYEFQVGTVGNIEHKVKNGAMIDYAMSKNILGFEAGIGFRNVEPKESRSAIVEHLNAFKWVIDKAYASLK